MVGKGRCRGRSCEFATLVLGTYFSPIRTPGEIITPGEIMSFGVSPVNYSDSGSDSE